MRRAMDCLPAPACRPTARGLSNPMRRSPNSSADRLIFVRRVLRSDLRTGSMSERIPISIVTGFLGSGKTTLIAALLDQPAMRGAAIVVNEFGAVGIDDAVFAQTLDASDVVLLANG